MVVIAFIPESFYHFFPQVYVITTAAFSLLFFLFFFLLFLWFMLNEVDLDLLPVVFFWCWVKAVARTWSLPQTWDPSWHIKRHEVRCLKSVSRRCICKQYLAKTWRVLSCDPSSHHQAFLPERTRVVPWVVLLEVQFKVQNGQLPTESASGWMLRAQT